LIRNFRKHWPTSRVTSEADWREMRWAIGRCGLGHFVDGLHRLATGSRSHGEHVVERGEAPRRSIFALVCASPVLRLETGRISRV